MNKLKFQMNNYFKNSMLVNIILISCMLFITACEKADHKIKKTVIKQEQKETLKKSPDKKTLKISNNKTSALKVATNIILSETQIQKELNDFADQLSIVTSDKINFDDINEKYPLAYFSSKPLKKWTDKDWQKLREILIKQPKLAEQVIKLISTNAQKHLNNEEKINIASNVVLLARVVTILPLADRLYGSATYAYYNAKRTDLAAITTFEIVDKYPDRSKINLDSYFGTISWMYNNKGMTDKAEKYMLDWWERYNSPLEERAEMRMLFARTHVTGRSEKQNVTGYVKLIELFCDDSIPEDLRLSLKKKSLYNPNRSYAKAIDICRKKGLNVNKWAN